MGQLEFGIYDDYDNVPAAELEQNYGIHGRPIHRLPGQTGAGHPADEDDVWDHIAKISVERNDDWVDMDEAATNEVNQNTYNEPIPVPAHNIPFVSDAELEAFRIRLSQYEDSKFIPAGYGMLSDEWENGVYPTIQVIPVGHRGSRQLDIGLPDIIWRPRSQVWVRALDIMNQIQNVRR